MSKKSYYELLKDARWQKKRLKIMEAADFECERCHANSSQGITLNVHHSYYLKNTKPWEYPDRSLFCLCESCHKIIQEIQEVTKMIIGDSGVLGIEEVYGYALGLMLSRNPHIDIEYGALNPLNIDGFVNFWKIDQRTLLRSLKLAGRLNSKQLIELRRKLSDG